ncbi:MAG: hypothetical protein JSV52_11655 [Candidatus Zixiibacteriota bacterium]|nr:MAG: hypothetical protein JSV52_11655 [candidate division Zixibacteria bacterium]
MDHIYLLRHFLATLAFRTQHAIRGAPEHYPEFKAGKNVWTPLRILNHMTEIVVSTNEVYRGHDASKVELLPWDEVVEKFHSALHELDTSLLEVEPPRAGRFLELFQGPWLDMMTHVGQLMTLRRLAGAPVETEPYYRSKIRVGQVGPDQPLETT